MTVPPSITDMPDVVMDEILGYLHFHEVLTLRKVSHFFLHFIDDVTSQSTLKDLTVSIHPEKIRLDYFSKLNEMYQVEYQKTENFGAILNFGAINKMFENSNFMDLCLQDLKIVISSQKSLTRVFQIFGHAPKEFLAACQEILKNRPRPLKVEEFHMYSGGDEEEIFEILKLLDEKSIVAISLYRNSGNLESENSCLKIEKMGELEHWKKAEQLHIDKFQVDIRTSGIGILGNFLLVEITVDGMNMEEVMVLKEKYLPNPDFAESNIKFIIFEDPDTFLDHMGPTVTHQSYHGTMQQQWFFAGSPNDRILRISFNSDTKYVNFRKIGRTEVPEGALIVGLL